VSKFELIDAEKATYRIDKMTCLLEVSRSGYYAWRRRRDAGPGPRAVRRAELTDKIVAAHVASDGVNGAPRIVADLREAGEQVSRKTVAKLMRARGIAGISPATWHPVTTIPGAWAHTIPDLVQRRFDRGKLDVVWTSDITYLPTGQGWLYLCAVRDGCSRRVLGWAIDDHLRTDLVQTALRRAVTLRGRDVAGVIFHADRGCQYTSAQLADAAERLGVRLSVGRTGVCWDNAQIESFWSTLKHEHYNRHRFATKAEAIRSVGHWIEQIYNRHRRHSALGMISPVTFERQHQTTAAEAA
jgi:transposase InsO family protein